MPLKLFVWENAFCDYTCGLAVALAENVEEARDLIEAAFEFRHDDLEKEPKVYELDRAVGFAAYGGG